MAGARSLVGTTLLQISRVMLEICNIFFTFKGPCIAKYMAIIVQQDVTIYRIFISVNCSTCFECYLHPSLEAHVTVSTASGTSKTVTATRRERELFSAQSRSQRVAFTVLLTPDAVDTVTWASGDGWRYHPKHVERFTDINKPYIVASCWTIIGKYATLSIAII